MGHIDYDKDILKHFIRTNGWLPACRQQALIVEKRPKKYPLRYFTFCASGAMDVFMLEKENILTRSRRNGRLEGVYFCEESPEDFGTIARLIGSPEQGFLGEFDKIVLFTDDRDTTGKDLYTNAGDYYPEAVRTKLRYKDAQRRLRAALPFDIINLDVYGLMFPSKRDPRKYAIAPLIDSIKQLLQWQSEAQFSKNCPCQQFTLFLTSHIDPTKTNQDAIEQLANRLADNINTNSEFRSAFVHQYGHQDVDKLIKDNFAEFFGLALPKFLIADALFNLGWEVTSGPTYLYNRQDKREQDRTYQMMHMISVYRRIPDAKRRLDNPQVSKYTTAITQLINNGIQWIDALVENPNTINLLESDLENIIEFREQLRSGVISEVLIRSEYFSL